MTAGSLDGRDTLIEDVVGAACWGIPPRSLVELAHGRVDVLHCAARRVRTLSAGRLGGRPRGVVRHDVLRALDIAARDRRRSGPRPRTALSPVTTVRHDTH